MSKLQHIAVIPDGNGRWALAHGFERLNGHREGAKRLIPLIDKVKECNIPYLSFYALSTENFEREQSEVLALQQIIQAYLANTILPYALLNGINVNFIGKRDRLILSLAQTMTNIEKQASKAGKIQVTFAIDYGGRQEIEHACNTLYSRAGVSSFSYQDLASNFYTANLPDPDVIVRYGGYKRLSNFMPLQSVYAELVFMEKFWPDFCTQDIDTIIEDYSKIKRNYGKL